MGKGDQGQKSVWGPEREWSGVDKVEGIFLLLEFGKWILGFEAEYEEDGRWIWSFSGGKTVSFVEGDDGSVAVVYWNSKNISWKIPFMYPSLISNLYPIFNPTSSFKFIQ